MKYFFPLFAFLLFLSCGGGRQERQEESGDSLLVENKPHELPPLFLRDTLNLGGHMFVYEVLRESSDSLPMAHDALLGDTRDNIVRMHIWRDGALLFERSFTKTFFRSQIDEAFFSRAILDGIRFHEASAVRGLTFVLSVSEPDSDMTMPFALTIGADGKLSVSRMQVDFVDEDFAP